MKCPFFVCSESSAIDAQTGRVSIFHILEDLHVVSAPFIIHSLAVVAFLSKEDHDDDVSEGKIEISIADRIISTFQVSINFQGQLRHRSLSLIQGTIVTAFGVLLLKLTIKDVELARWSVSIMQVNLPVNASSAVPQPNTDQAEKPSASKTIRARLERLASRPSKPGKGRARKPR
jgi:hypothetical protein